MMNALFIVQALAWPACVTACVWFACKHAGDYARLAMAQYTDAQLAAATAIANRALKESKAAREQFERAREQSEIEVQQLKSALVSRSMG